MQTLVVRHKFLCSLCVCVCVCLRVCVLVCVFVLFIYMPELLFPTTLNLFIYVVFECAMVSEISEDSQCAVKEEIFGVEEDIFVEKYGKSFQCGNKYSDTACFTRKLQMLCAEILKKSHFHPV